MKASGSIALPKLMLLSQSIALWITNSSDYLSVFMRWVFDSSLYFWGVLELQGKGFALDFAELDSLYMLGPLCETQINYSAVHEL